MQNQGRTIVPKSPLSAQEEGKGRCIAEHEISRMSQYYTMQNEPILYYADCAWVRLLLALLGCLEPNAGRQARLEAEAQRKLEAVACTTWLYCGPINRDST